METAWPGFPDPRADHPAALGLTGCARACAAPRAQPRPLYQLHADLAARYPGPIATGENLFSMQDMRNLLRHAGLRKDRDILQMDPVLSYGLVEYLRMLEVLAEMGWSRDRLIPHGGHQFALNIAAGLGLGGNESYPEVFAPFGGFADNTAVEDGMIRLPEIPGIGFETKSDLMDLFRSLFSP